MKNEIKATTYSNSSPRPVLRTLDVLCVVACVLGLFAWILNPIEVFFGSAHLTISRGAKSVVIPVLLIAVRVLLTWRGRAITACAVAVLTNRWTKRVALSVGSVILFFALFEWILIRVGFEMEMPPLVIAGDTPEGAVSRGLTVRDPELRWRLNPGVMFNGRPVNSMGFFDREVDPVKKPGNVRVICMGDSCTGQGIPPYSGFLHERLTENPPTEEPWECFNMGVHGYSCAQGLRLFQLRGKELKPDVVTLYFGWNDHWLSRKPDSNLMAVRMGRTRAYLFAKLQERRYFQFLVYLTNPMRSAPSEDPEGLVLRVGPEEYVETLKRFVAEIRSADAMPILLTAPRAARLTPLLIHNRQTRDLKAVAQLHDEYVELTRQVAASEGVALLDLAEMFSGPESAHMMTDDGIHLQREARIRIADELHRMLIEHGPEIVERGRD